MPINNRTLRVNPYKPASKSAKMLANSLGCKRLKPSSTSRFVPATRNVVFNWGTSQNFSPALTINQDCSIASDKLSSFCAFFQNNVSCPEAWTQKADIPAHVFPVVCRTILNGHSGNGIVIANTREELVNAPLYTRYVKKKEEYRVHVFAGIPIFISRKAKAFDAENVNWQIRNLGGGFKFVEGKINEVPFDVIDQSIKAVKAVRLDYGAVDVGWNEKEQKAYVFEVNSAPGLEDRTAKALANAVLDFGHLLR